MLSTGFAAPSSSRSVIHRSEKTTAEGQSDEVFPVFEINDQLPDFGATAYPPTISPTSPSTKAIPRDGIVIPISDTAL